MWQGKPSLFSLTNLRRLFQSCELAFENYQRKNCWDFPLRVRWKVEAWHFPASTDNSDLPYWAGLYQEQSVSSIIYHLKDWILRASVSSTMKWALKDLPHTVVWGLSYDYRNSQIQRTAHSRNTRNSSSLASSLRTRH